MRTSRATFNLINVCTVITVHIVSSLAWCAIPPYDSGWSTKPHNLDVSFRANDDFSKGFNIAAVQPIESMRDVREADVQRVIPQDMAPSSDGGQVAAKILDRSLSSYFNSDAMKRTDLGRTAHKVEKSMTTDVSFGGKQPESIHHSLKFALQPAQTQAKISYTGLADADLTYQAMQATTNFEVREPMPALSTNLVFNHINSPSDRKDMLSLRWIW